MISEALVEGRFYAYRERRGPGHPLIKVKLLEKLGRRGKLRVRFMDGPYPGLEDYVNTRQLVVPWGERRAFLRDEEREQRLEEYCRETRDPAVAEATSAFLRRRESRALALGRTGISGCQRTSFSASPTGRD
jgi:hypothetical protein